MMLEAFAASSRPIPEAAWRYYKKLVPLSYGQGPCYAFGPIKWLVGKLIGLTQPMMREPTSKADMRVWAHKSTALACENLMLALRAFGYDSCPIEGLDSKRVRRLLALPHSAEICMVIAAGKRATNGVYGPQLRFDPSYFVFEV